MNQPPRPAHGLVRDRVRSEPFDLKSQQANRRETCSRKQHVACSRAAADLLSSSMEDYCNDVIALATKLMTYKGRRTLTSDDIKFASTIKQSNTNNLCAGLSLLQRVPTKHPHLQARRLDRRHRPELVEHFYLRREQLIATESTSKDGILRIAGYFQQTCQVWKPVDKDICRFGWVLPVS